VRVQLERPQVRPERVTESYAIASFRQIVVWVVDGHTPVDELERLRLHVLEWTRAQGDAKNVALTVLHSNRSTMSAEERRIVARMIDETKGSRLASATVVLADGMLGALHRSILTGFSLLVPPPHPTKICGDLPSALAFLAPHIEKVAGDVPPAHIEAIVDDLHGAVRAQRQLVAEIVD
jgi:hypothetical protein